MAGGQPKITYVDRQSLRLEEKIQRYLEEKHKILSISGPTKSGKTVLVRKLLPKGKALWISGGQVEQIDDFWTIVNEEIGKYSSFSSKESSVDGNSNGLSLAVHAKMAGSGVDLSKSKSLNKSTNNEIGRTWNIDPKRAAIRSLMESGLPLVIDDFHYLEKSVQATLIRTLKDPVFDGLPLILLSVPHRSFDAVRVEREMTGRLTQIPISLWDAVELGQIAYLGFEKLNLKADIELIRRLATESFGSPHLMQDFCSSLCRENGISVTQDDVCELNEPGSWKVFFENRASETSKTAFDRLAMGPRQRTERMQRRTYKGDEIDIYEAVLLAIANTGPKTSLKYEVQ